MRTLLAALTLLAVTSCGGESQASAEPETFTAEGSLVLMAFDGVNYAGYGKRGEHCWGEDGYGDLDAGAEVVVRDGDGTRVALGTLGPGELVGRDGEWCRFKFAALGVPAGSGIFTVEVAHRGEVSFRQADAGKLELSIGGY